jgi:hypothetical protein
MDKWVLLVTFDIPRSRNTNQLVETLTMLLSLREILLAAACGTWIHGHLTVLAHLILKSDSVLPCQSTSYLRKMQFHSFLLVDYPQLE